jgi:hypothetical protein
MNNNLLKKLNEDAWITANNYISIPIADLKVRTPYYINRVEDMFLNLMRSSKISAEKVEEVHTRYKNREIPFGWYRGKGTPEEIKSATYDISKVLKFDLNTANEEIIRDFMKLYGIGIDCSGLVYNVLKTAFSKNFILEKLNNSLNWAKNEENIKDVYHAGAFVFGNEASVEIKPDDIRELDLRLIKLGDKYTHISIFLRDPMLQNLYFVESGLDGKISGATIEQVIIKDDNIYVGDKLKKQGTHGDKSFELRRLKCLI